MPSGDSNSFLKNIGFVVAGLLFVGLIFNYQYYTKKTQTKVVEIKEEQKELNVSTHEIVKTVDVSNLELLGTAESSFAGGTDGRGKNIEIGISKINGATILPGETFSFKGTLGTTTPADGYSFERAFLNGEVKKEIGGGLCQVSTLLFRVAMASGLQIAERANHSYTVSYYDVGLDATYSDPGPDLKFINNTANPIVIKGRVEDLKAIFEIYGVKDGRVASTSDVEITNIIDFPPTKYVYVNELQEGQTECMNMPQIGYTAKIKYGVEYKDGQYKEQEFVSNYRPLQRICYIVGDKIKSFDINKFIKV